jgi:hypothetical protein
MPEIPGRFSPSKRAGAYQKPRALSTISQGELEAVRVLDLPPVRVAGHREVVAERVAFDVSEGLVSHFTVDANGNLFSGDQPVGLTVVKLRTVHR